MSTYLPKPGEIQRDWHVVDASGQVLGRLAAKIAMIATTTSSSTRVKPDLLTDME